MANRGRSIKRLIKRGASPNDCWVWLGRLNQFGYGLKQWLGRPVLARRWLWELIEGPITPGYVLLSSCNNNACVNPAHLRSGLPSLLSREGEASKLVPADVTEIRAHAATFKKNTRSRGKLANELAEAYGVEVHTIWDIWRGDSWSRSKRHPVAGLRPSGADA